MIIRINLQKIGIIILIFPSANKKTVELLYYSFIIILINDNIKKSLFLPNNGFKKINIVVIYI